MKIFSKFGITIKMSAIIDFATCNFFQVNILALRTTLSYDVDHDGTELGNNPGFVFSNREKFFIQRLQSMTKFTLLRY